MNKKYDVVIIGGGVTGSFIARELSRYNLDIALLEKEPDVCTGTSKANTALIHAGFNADSNKLKGRLNVRGNKLYHEKVQHELEVPIEWLGAMVVAESESDIPKLEAILENGQKNEVPDLEIATGDRLYELEPNLSDDAVAALYAPTAGIVNPFELTVALANNAAKNGVDVFLEAGVESIEIKEDHKLLQTAKGEIKTNLIINAAGLYADKIANMVGIEKFKITPRRGEYYLYDKKMELDLQKTIFPVPTKVSKGIVVTPTDERNILIGPNAEEIESVENKSTTRAGLDKVMEGANKTIPGLSKKELFVNLLV